jgi:hypothetical protein
VQARDPRSARARSERAGGFGAHQVVYPSARSAARRRSRSRDEKPPNARAVRAERLEQLQHARIVGTRLARESEPDMTRKVPVAYRHGIGITRREVHDVRARPRTHAGNAKEKILESRVTDRRRPLEPARVARETAHRCGAAPFDADATPLPIG